MHEAGHAIVQLASGPAPWIDHIEVNKPDEKKLGIVQTEPLWQSSYMTVAAPAEIVAQWRKLAARDVVIDLAGPVAELRTQGHTRLAIQLGHEQLSRRCLGTDQLDPITDFAKVRCRLAWLMPSDEAAGFKKAWSATDVVVASWWREIRELAGVLAARGRIEDHELMPLWTGMRDKRSAAAMHRAARVVDWLED